MAQVVVEVEPRVVDPNRVTERRDAFKPLPEAAAPPEGRLRERANALEVEAAVGRPQRLALKELDRTHVHVDVRRLDGEEGGVKGGEAVVVHVAHRYLG